jgi:phosphoglycolate phosphatase-like HAD superfamily hydrolase
MIEKIYFDMDGVLADFNRGIRELCHMEPSNQDVQCKTADDEMWEAVRSVGHFYDKLEPMPGAVEMFVRLQERYGDKCEILTGIPKPHRGIITSGEDKTAWAHRILSENLIVNIVLREEKQNYAKGGGYILIDDLEKNIKEWNDAGGTGIRFTSAEETLSRIAELDEHSEDK